MIVGKPPGRCQGQPQSSGGSTNVGEFFSTFAEKGTAAVFRHFKAKGRATLRAEDFGKA